MYWLNPDDRLSMVAMVLAACVVSGGALLASCRDDWRRLAARRTWGIGALGVGGWLLTSIVVTVATGQPRFMSGWEWVYGFPLVFVMHGRKADGTSESERRPRRKESR